jgi:hypothetical protein
VCLAGEQAICVNNCGAGTNSNCVGVCKFFGIRYFAQSSAAMLEWMRRSWGTRAADIARTAVGASHSSLPPPSRQFPGEHIEIVSRVSDESIRRVPDESLRRRTNDRARTKTDAQANAQANPQSNSR